MEIETLLIGYPIEKLLQKLKRLYPSIQAEQRFEFNLSNGLAPILKLLFFANVSSGQFEDLVHLRHRLITLVYKLLLQFSLLRFHVANLLVDLAEQAVVGVQPAARTSLHLQTTFLQFCQRVQSMGSNFQQSLRWSFKGYRLVASSDLFLVMYIVPRDCHQCWKHVLVVDPVESIVLFGEVVVDNEVFRCLAKATAAVMSALTFRRSEVGALQTILPVLRCYIFLVNWLVMLFVLAEDLDS